MEDSINFLSNIWSKIKTVIKQLGMIILYFIIVVSLQLSFRQDMISSNLWLANLSSIFVELVTLIIFIFIFRKTIVPDLKDFKENGKKYIHKNAIYWFIGLVIMIISNLIISNFIGMSANEEANQSILVLMPIYSFIAMVIIAPITEELMTRIILKDDFKNIYVYSLLSGLIFGSLHLLTATSLIEILYIIPYGVLGFMFSLMYSKTNNIWTSITFHSIHNLIALILFFIGG